MPQQISLKKAERKAFKASFNDGLWDVFLGCFVLMFAVAPVLSDSLGDFWSSFVFLPFWGLVYGVIWLVRRNVVTPRTGVVRLGTARKARLRKLNLILSVVNVAALVLGIAAAIYFQALGQLITIVLGLVLLVFFSVAAYFLDFNRLYIYGLLVGLAPLVGEWMYSRGHVAHHGFPAAFGVAAGVMILTGLVVFIRLLSQNPIPGEGAQPDEA